MIKHISLVPLRFIARLVNACISFERFDASHIDGGTCEVEFRLSDVPVKRCIPFPTWCTCHESGHLQFPVTRCMVPEYVNIDTLNKGILINAGVTWVHLEGGCGYRNVRTWRTLWRRVSEVVKFYRGLRIDGTKSCAARAVMMTNISKSRGHYYNLSIGEVGEDFSTFGLHLGHQTSTLVAPFHYYFLTSIDQDNLLWPLHDQPRPGGHMQGTFVILVWPIYYQLQGAPDPYWNLYMVVAIRGSVGFPTPILQGLPIYRVKFLCSPTVSSGVFNVEATPTQLWLRQRWCRVCSVAPSAILIRAQRETAPKTLGSVHCGMMS
ncbi:hypothetical protein EDD16DRAFT_1729634, partial [Pisolithus croceorrhizus]